MPLSLMDKVTAVEVHRGTGKELEGDWEELDGKLQ